MIKADPSFDLLEDRIPSVTGIPFRKRGKVTKSFEPTLGAEKTKTKRQIGFGWCNNGNLCRKHQYRAVRSCQRQKLRLKSPRFAVDRWEIENLLISIFLLYLTAIATRLDFDESEA